MKKQLEEPVSNGETKPTNCKPKQHFTHNYKNNEYVNIYYQNIRGINTKLNSLIKSSDVYNYDIVAFTETWLKPDLSSSAFFNVDLFNIFRNDREGRSSGGILIAIETKFSSIKIDFDNFIFLKTINIVDVKIYLEDFVLILIIVYIPPALPVDFYEELFNFFMYLPNIFSQNHYYLGL